VTRNNLANSYLRVGRTADALTLLEETHRRMAARLGPDHNNTLASRNNLAIAYLQAGRMAEAISMHEETLRLGTAKLGADHPHLLGSRNQLALAYIKADRTAEALTMFEETLKVMTAKLGPDHDDTINCRANVAMALWALGRLDRSIPLYEATLKMCERKLGPDHPMTLGALANLGINYRDAGRSADGVRLLQEVLKRGGTRPDAWEPLAWTRPELAAAYDAAGQPSRSEPIYHDALEHARKKFGPDDPRATGAMAALGRNLLQQQKYAEAESLLRECLAIRARKLPDNWSRFNAQSLLGAALLGQKRFAEAEPLLVQGYMGLKARAEAIPPKGRNNLAEAAGRVVRLYAALGHPDKAHALLRPEDRDAMMPNGAAVFAR
jgi:tetratricopeptide (TPR) repeat protein